jgi:hypothetical protein
MCDDMTAKETKKRFVGRQSWSSKKNGSKEVLTGDALYLPSTK